ncbi:MAG: hypothetical protein QG639_231, partial [Patescibacteria group bacterium]|nr:hypothetical protein [Patescibacteria group bacterium]
DTVIIDENKVNIINRDFFSNYHLRSILIEDISDVSVDTGILFASLTIVDSSNYRFPITAKIDFLSKKNALEARKLIQGLILAKSKNIGLSEMPINKVREEMEILGQSSQ